MAMIRWNPRQELEAMHERMNRLWDESFSRLGRPSEWFGGRSEEWSVNANIFETENDIVLKAEMPGVKKEDLFLEIRDNSVYLKAERKSEEEEREEGYHLHEFRYGAFQRCFTLPCNVNQDKIRAEFKDGILKVTMPKTESFKSKRIAIQS